MSIPFYFFQNNYKETGISVLLLFFKCIVATSSFHHVDRVRYQGEYFLHIGISVLLFSNV